jgi:nicotinamidase-related amidase
MVEQSELASELRHLLDLARMNQFLIVHVPFGGSAQTYPSPAQQKLTHLLSGTENGVKAPDEFAPREDDIALDPRHTLSAFNQTQLDDLLKARKIEHLIAVGPYANLSLDSSIRDGVQLGYHLTVLESCISAEGEEELKAFKLTIPRYAQTVVGLSKFETIVQQSQI